MTVAQIQTPPRLTMIMRYEARARNFFVKRSLSKNAPSAKLKTTPRMAMTREPRALSRKVRVSAEARQVVEEGKGQAHRARTVK